MSYFAGGGGALGCVSPGREVTRATRQTTPAARRNRRRLDMRDVHPQLIGSGTWGRLLTCLLWWGRFVTCHSSPRQVANLPHEDSKPAPQSSVIVAGASGIRQSTH